MANCTLLFLRKNDEILLGMKKRGFGAGRWNGIGGKIDPNETVEQALVRECQEEIGVKPISYIKVAYHNFINDFAIKSWNQQVHVYFCDAWDGVPIETEEMVPRWFRICDIPYKIMWPSDQMWLPLILEGKKIKTDFNFDKHDEILTAVLHVLKEFQ